MYYKSIRVDQDQLGLVVLDHVLRAWLDEAILVSDFLPRWMRAAAFRDLRHQWFWDGQEHVDPAKEANAQATRLTSYTTNLAYEYARQGRDWESELRQRAKEMRLMCDWGFLRRRCPNPLRQPNNPRGNDMATSMQAIGGGQSVKPETQDRLNLLSEPGAVPSRPLPTARWVQTRSPASRDSRWWPIPAARCGSPVGDIR